MKYPPAVRTGLDRLVTEFRDRLVGRRIGLLAHHASFTTDQRFAAHAINHAGGTVTRFFGPEHGLWGTAQDMIAVAGTHDPWTGLPLVSLYGDEEGSLRPRPEALAGLDLLVIDLQDVGARYYTYAATAAMAAEVAQSIDLEVLVLDRPNPIGGRVEGNVLQPEMHSFVGMYDVPQRHGLSFGELVSLYSGGACEVIPMTGYRRDMWYDDTGLPWIPPSPNMPTLTTATIYPGMCLIEGTNLSEGRGTTTPFELVGAPFIDPFRFADALNALDLAGVRFRPHVFKPMFQKHAGSACGGVQIVVTDRGVLRPLRLGIAVLSVAFRLYPKDAAWRSEVYEFIGDRLAIDLLFGAPGIRERIEVGDDPNSIADTFLNDEAAFVERRKRWLIHV